MASTKKYLKQLKDRDADKRLSAIKALARAKERDALVQLARMAGDDKDASVRDMARKAGSYILKETGGMESGTVASTEEQNFNAPPPRQVDKKGKLLRLNIDDADEKAARALLDDALSYHTNGQTAKTMRSLAKALVLNPNLRGDSYFTSLAEEATGISGEAAVQMLYDDNKRENANQKSQKMKSSKRAERHHSEISSATWADVVFDMGLYFAISTVAAIIVGFIVVQSAQSYVNSIETNWSNWNIAGLAQQVVDEDDPTNIQRWVERDEEGDRILFSYAQPDISFFNRAQDIANTEVAMIFMVGLGIGLAGTMILGIMNGVTHLVSAKVLSGVGTSPYLMHRVTGLFINRSVIVGVVAGVSAILVFGAGGGLILQIFGGVIALVVLTIVFKWIATVGQAYDFGFMKGMVATSAGSGVVALIVGLTMIFVIN